MPKCAVLSWVSEETIKLVIEFDDIPERELDERLKEQPQGSSNRGQFELVKEGSNSFFVVNYKPARPLQSQGYTLHETIAHAISVLQNDGYQIKFEEDFWQTIEGQATLYRSAFSENLVKELELNSSATIDQIIDAAIRKISQDTNQMHDEEKVLWADKENAYQSEVNQLALFYQLDIEALKHLVRATVDNPSSINWLGILLVVLTPFIFLWNLIKQCWSQEENNLAMNDKTVNHSSVPEKNQNSCLPGGSVYPSVVGGSVENSCPPDSSPVTSHHNEPKV